MLAARISGDRFAIFVPETSVDTTHDIADNLRRSFERLGFLRERQQVEVTASFGVANVVEGTIRSRMRSRPRRSRARPPRTAAATASRPTTTATRASCVATPT